jgi:release factor glutamine methyltransferase
MSDTRDNTDQPWTIIRLLEWTRGFFTSKGIDDARLEAELLLAHALGTERMQLYMQHDQVVAEPALSTFRDLVKRRAERVPSQYLLGTACFRHLELKVTPAVLIPRPETEILVDEALDLIRPRHRPEWEFARGEFVDHRTDEAAEAEPELIATGDAPPAPREARVLDLCTGSGCIALAIAGECPHATVIATDVSAEALEVARENVETCGFGDRVTLLEGDLFAALDSLPKDERTFDLITANPPYVNDRDMATLMPEVRDHEPHIALASGPDGMTVIDRLLAEAPAHLKPGASMLMEIGYDQADEVRRRVDEGSALALVKVRKDLSGHERIVHVRRA